MTLDEAILEMLDKHEVTDQAALLDWLRRGGHRLTQPTLSRHLRKLGIEKVSGRYQRVELAPTELPAYLITVVPPNLVIIKTRPGYAQALAVRMDQRAIEGVVGTLAGDDTVFIAVAPERKLKTAAEAVREILEGAAAA